MSWEHNLAGNPYGMHWREERQENAPIRPPELAAIIRRLINAGIGLDITDGAGDALHQFRVYTPATDQVFLITVEEERRRRTEGAADLPGNIPSTFCATASGSISDKKDQDNDPHYRTSERDHSHRAHRAAGHLLDRRRRAGL